MRAWVFAIGVVSACAPDARDAVRAKSAQDFGCDEGQIRVDALENGEYRATGCGRESLYALEGTKRSPPARCPYSEN